MIGNEGTTALPMHAQELPYRIVIRLRPCRISDEDLKRAPSGQAWKLVFVRNGARYWYDPSYDSSWMLEGIAPNMNFMPHVFGLFRDYDVGKERCP